MILSNLANIERVFFNNVEMFNVFANGVHVFHKQQTGDITCGAITKVASGAVGDGTYYHTYQFVLANNTAFDVETDILFTSTAGTPFSSVVTDIILSASTKLFTRTITNLNPGATNTVRAKPDNLPTTVATEASFYVYS